MHWYTSYGEVEVETTVFILRNVKPNKRINPLEASIGVVMNSYSKPLQRIATDFGADESFKDASNKIREHYGIELPISGIRKITLKHAIDMEKLQQATLSKLSTVYSPIHRNALPNKGIDFIIAETDGTMVPIVSTSGDKEDQRKNRSVSWKEAKVTLAYPIGSMTPFYSASMNGVDDAGKRLRWCAVESGLSKNTYVHAVGDGAPWIVSQVNIKFGDVSHGYLIDMFHLKEYLSVASQVIFSTTDQQSLWVNSQAENLKTGNVEQVLHNIKSYTDNGLDSAVNTCYQYMDNRQTQLNYKFAIDNELPIGSGRIESSHRYVAQERLKISGAWWLIDNANAMLALRTHRINGKWKDYWKKQ